MATPFPSSLDSIRLSNLSMRYHGRTQPKIAGGGAVRGSEGHPPDDDLASEQGHLLAKKGTFFHDYRGGAAAPLAPR